jgi:two-component sensor histidine kinase
VASIAIVHETLSETLDEQVDFDRVSDRLSEMMADVTSERADVGTSRGGSFGLLPAEIATPLAMVVTELLQNAVEHGLAGRPGSLHVEVERSSVALHVEIDDDGQGLPVDFDQVTSASLGLSIVRTLVESELGGGICLGDRPGGGTRAMLDIPLRRAG